MNYEKTTCPTCLTSVTNLDLLLGEAAKQVQVELYDFGGGITIAPTPNIGPSSSGKYLVDHMVAIQGNQDTFYPITAVRFAYNDLTLEDMIRKLANAKEYNKLQTKAFEIIEVR